MAAEHSGSRERLLERLRDRTRAMLADIPEVQAADVYALGFELLEDEEELSAPHIALSWNTAEQLVSVDQAAGGRLYLNSRWNLGTWVASGIEIEDDELRSLADAALQECGILGSDPLPDLDSDEATLMVIAIHDQAARFLADLTRTLHAEDVLVQTLGHEVLVLCHTGSDSEPWTRLTLDANPPELYGDFLAFHEQDGVHDETF